MRCEYLGTHFIFFFFLLLSLFLPLRFHFHIHGRRRKIFFFVETSFAGLPFLHRTFSLTLEWPQKTEGKREKETQPAAGGGTEEPAGPFPLVPDGLSHISTLLRWYGIGGTFFYLLSPSPYRRWLTVAQETEKRGKFSRFTWGTVLGLEDAALTGMATGILWGIKGTILGLLQRSYKFDRTKHHVMVLPSYNLPGWETMLDCIFTVRMGHIILGGIKGFMHTITRREDNHDRTPDRGIDENGNGKH